MSSDPDFAARLDRIRARQGQAVLMVGQDEQHVLPRKAAPNLSRRREIAENLVYPGSLLGALLLGMFGVFAGRYVHFQLLASVTELQDPMSELIFAAVFGLGAAFVLSQAFKLTSKEHRSLQGMGVFLMVCLFHNLAHLAPAPMSLAFSPAYVAEIVATTPRASFRLGGSFYPLVASAAPPAPEPALDAPPAAVDCTAAPAAAPVKPKVWALNDTPKSNGPKTLRPQAATDPATTAVQVCP